MTVDEANANIYRSDGEKWLGLGFNENPDKMADSSKVKYMEATLGEKPTLYLDAC